jgi:hypothetical protein
MPKPAIPIPEKRIGGLADVVAPLTYAIGSTQSAGPPSRGTPIAVARDDVWRGWRLRNLRGYAHSVPMPGISALLSVVRLRGKRVEKRIDCPKNRWRGTDSVDIVRLGFPLTPAGCQPCDGSPNGEWPQQESRRAPVITHQGAGDPAIAAAVRTTAVPATRRRYGRGRAADRGGTSWRARPPTTRS